MLLASFEEEVYFKGIRSRHVGFQNSTLLQMLQHLYTNYGIITPTDLEDNDVQMRENFDANKPIEELFEQIEEAVEYADAANAPYNETHIVSRAILLVFKTGIYNDSCREWRKRPITEQTWNNFKEDFTKAHRDLLVQQTTRPNPFQEANAALAHFQAKTDEIIEHMSNSSVDSMVISTLTDPNTTNTTSDLSSMKELVQKL